MADDATTLNYVDDATTVDETADATTVTVSDDSTVVESAAAGAPGVGVPSGGTTGQALVKNSNADYDTHWSTPSTVAALDDLTDVTAPSPASGDGLVWNGTAWVNVDVATQAELNAHTGATGTAVHGLGTASTHAAADFDAAGTASSAVSAHVAATDPHGDRAYAAGLVDDLSGVTNASTARTNLGLGTAATKDVPASGNASSSQVVKGDDTRLTDNRTPTGSAGGDLTGTYPSPSIANSAVTLAKMANLADQRILGNNTGGSAAPVALTAANVWAILSGAQSADVAFNSKKITGLANGTATGNAATWDQTPAGIVSAKGDIISATGANAVQRNAVGADGSTITADANSAGGVIWARKSYTLLRSGQYALAQAVLSTPSTMVGSGRACYMPIMIDRRTAFDRIAVNHSATSTSAGGTCELGVYSNVSDGPGTKLWSAGTVALDTAAAFKTITINQTLDAGIYWLAALVVYSGSNPSFTGIATNHPVPGLPVTASSAPTALGGCLQETGLATLGTNAAPSYTAGVTGIYVYLRVA